jgi:hypothetical protein
MPVTMAFLLLFLSENLESATTCAFYENFVVPSRHSSIRLSKSKRRQSPLERAAFRPASWRHFADTGAESSPQMRDDFKVPRSPIWCRAARGVPQCRFGYDGAREGGVGWSMARTVAGRVRLSFPHLMGEINTA